MKTKATVNAAHHPLRGYPPSLRGVSGCRSRALALGALLLGLGLGAARPASALTTYSSDTTISTTISDDVQVTGSANVNLVPGGVITGNLTAYNSSAVTLTGGTVNGSVTANDSSTITVLDGSTIGSGLVANESCTVRMSGGSISQSSDSAVVVNSGTVNISGGTISGDWGVVVNGGTASISSGTIFGRRGVVVNGGTANISGGSISGIVAGVETPGGAVNISGGSIFGTTSAFASSFGLYSQGAAVIISGGSISGSSAGVYVETGTVSIFGGSISGPFGVAVVGGTASIYGCGLQLSGGTLTGTLQDGTPINTPTLALAAGDLHNQLPQISPPANITVPTDSNVCTATLNPGTATVAGSDCGSIPSVIGARSDGQALSAAYPLGSTTLTWMATDSFGQQSQALQTVTVVDTQKPALTLPASQTVNATSDAGAPVSFTVAATDNCGTPTLICKNQNSQIVTSGATFPLGTTVVTCTATDGSGNQSAGSFSITVLPRADLAISLGASPMPVKNKQNLTFTLRVSNTGPTTAAEVVISDPLPADTTFLRATASAGVTLSTPPVGTNGTLLGKLASLPPNGSPVTVTLTVAVNTKKTSISNTASLSAGTPDPVTSNNTTTLAVTVK